MNFTVAALFGAAWGMGIGFLLLRYGPAQLTKMQASIITEAEKRGLGGLARLMSRGQHLILKLGGALFFLAGVAVLVMALLDALGIISID